MAETGEPRRRIGRLDGMADAGELGYGPADTTGAAARATAATAAAEARGVGSGRSSCCCNDKRAER
jgi:hypothetical protein